MASRKLQAETTYALSTGCGTGKTRGTAKYMDWMKEEYALTTLLGYMNRTMKKRDHIFPKRGEMVQDYDQESKTTNTAALRYEARMK